MHKFLHVAIGFAEKEVGFEQIQKLFVEAGWARYAPNCWLIHTTESPTSVANRIRNVCAQNDSIFVCEVNIDNRYGYLQKEIWNWLESPTG